MRNDAMEKWAITEDYDAYWRDAEVGDIWGLRAYRRGGRAGDTWPL